VSRKRIVEIKKRLVSDSSSLILLHKAGLVGYLIDKYDITVPVEVSEEICIEGYDGSGFFRENVAYGRIRVSEFMAGSEKIHGMDRGEASVINLFLMGEWDSILIDDGSGIRFCREKSIPHVNALLVLRIMYLKKHCSENFYNMTFEWFRNNGRYSRFVLGWAEKAEIIDIPCL